MLTYRTFKDKATCKKIWNKFSHKKTLWDLWEFRYCFYDKDPIFNFIVVYEKDKGVGLVPLIYDKHDETFYYFGELFPEQNKIFLKDLSNLHDVIDQLPFPTTIYYVDKSMSNYYDFKVSEKRYFIDFIQYEHNIDNFLLTFNRKHRKNLRYDLRKLRKKGFVVEKGNIDDFDILVEHNQEAFDESDYLDEKFYKSMKKLITFADKKRMLDTVKIVKNNNIYAAGMGVIYNKSYYVVAMGRDIDIINIGKMLIYEMIKSALDNKCNTIDFLSTESGWKELWHLDIEQMYEFEKTNHTSS